MKKKIDVMEHASVIMKALSKGVLLTTKVGEKVNSMTISWGMLGIEWGKPIFVTVVRESRFTREMLDKNAEFTINAPLDDYDKEIMNVCGSKSGRDMDKIKELNLTLKESEEITVPGIKELPLTLECKVIYRQLQELQGMSKEDMERFYPQHTPDEDMLANRDRHIAFYGEIVAAYIIE